MLLAEDGAIIPLLSDEASRACSLTNGCAIVAARSRAGGSPGPYLQVVTFQVEREGRLQTPEYYCDVCAISVRYPQICPCCQGPMELRMKPDRR